MKTLAETLRSISSQPQLRGVFLCIREDSSVFSWSPCLLKVFSSLIRSNKAETFSSTSSRIQIMGNFKINLPAERPKSLQALQLFIEAFAYSSPGDEERKSAGRKINYSSRVENNSWASLKIYAIIIRLCLRSSVPRFMLFRGERISPLVVKVVLEHITRQTKEQEKLRRETI